MERGYTNITDETDVHIYSGVIFIHDFCTLLGISREYVSIPLEIFTML